MISSYDTYDFFSDYAGLTDSDGMKVIDFLDRISMDWDSGILGDLLSQMYENYLSGHDASGLADEMILTASDVLRNG